MSAVVVIAGIVALVWGGVLLRRLGLLAGCWCVLIAGCCFGASFFRISCGPLPVTIDRVLLVVLAMVYAVCRWRGIAAAKPPTIPDLLLATWLLSLTVSTVTHDWQVADSEPLSRLLFFFLLPAAIYWLARQSELNQRSLLLLLGGLVAFGVYLAVTAVAETQQLWWLVFPRYISSPTHNEFLGRGRGPLLNPVGNGLYLTVALLVVVSAWSRCRRGGRLALVLLGSLLLLGIFCTLTRSVWLGAALGCSLIGITFLPRRLRGPLVGTLAVLVVLVLSLGGQQLNTFKRDQHVSAYEMSQSASLRPILATVAWRMFLDRPLLGCGFGQYKQHDMDYWRDPNSDLPLEKARPYVQHNVVLALLTETGLVGTGLYLALWGCWARGALVLCRDAEVPPIGKQFGLVFAGFLVAFGLNGMFHDSSIIPMANMLLFLLAGVAQGQLAQTGLASPLRISLLTARAAWRAQTST